MALLLSLALITAAAVRSRGGHGVALAPDEPGATTSFKIVGNTDVILTGGASLAAAPVPALRFARQTSYQTGFEIGALYTRFTLNSRGV